MRVVSFGPVLVCAKKMIDPTSIRSPSSQTMVEGTLKWDTQPESNAWAQSSVIMLTMGITSGHRANRSTHVNRYGNPWEGGSGPTGDEYVIQVDEHEMHALTDLIHEVLKGLPSIAQSKWHYCVFEKAERCDDIRIRRSDSGIGIW